MPMGLEFTKYSMVIQSYLNINTKLFKYKIKIAINK